MVFDENRIFQEKKPNLVASTLSKLTSILGLNDFLVACIRARPNIPPGLLKPRLSTGKFNPFQVK